MDNELKEFLGNLTNDLNTKFDLIQGEIKGMREELKQTKKELKEDVNDLKKGQERLNKDVNDLKEGQERLNKDVNDLKEGQERLNKELIQTKKELKEDIRNTEIVLSKITNATNQEIMEIKADIKGKIKDIKEDVDILDIRISSNTKRIRKLESQEA